MAKRTTAKKKIIRTIACKNLVQLNEISNAGNPLCHCEERGFTISPFNMVCQVCVLYNPNSQDLTHDQLYTAEGAEGFEINWDEIQIDVDVDDDDFDSDADEFDDELLIDKVKFVQIEEDEEDDEDEEEVEEEEEEEDGLIIGRAKKKVRKKFFLIMRMNAKKPLERKVKPNL